MNRPPVDDYERWLAEQDERVGPYTEDELRGLSELMDRLRREKKPA